MAQEQNYLIDELKPCPFCGCKITDKHIYHQDNISDNIIYREDNWPKPTFMIECDCGISTSSMDEDKLVQVWNTRALDNKVDMIKMNADRVLKDLVEKSVSVPPEFEKVFLEN